MDGIDELTTVGIQGIWKKLQTIRYAAMQGIREIIRDHPNNIGIILAGREHFFDSEKELRNALGLSNSYYHLSISKFSDEQIKKYLVESGLSGQIPMWLPTRPLLIGYLAAHGFLDEMINCENDKEKSQIIKDPAIGWDYLLDKVCEREAQIEAGIDGHTIRRILERLATKSRIAEDGLCPLYPDKIIYVFKEICGYLPDEKGLLLLQRLPGLGIDRADEETRKFVDEDFADVCRAGDICEYISHPFDFDTSLFLESQCGLHELGIGISIHILNKCEYSENKINSSLDFAQKRKASEILKSDIIRILISGQWNITNRTAIQGCLIHLLTIDEDLPDASLIIFKDCFFSKIEIGPDVNSSKCPKFIDCYVGKIEGRVSKDDLPSNIFNTECIIDEFIDHKSTTNSIIALDLPLGTKVLLTILKKLYFQSGSGRKEKALSAGLDHHAKRIVSDVLKIAQSEGLIIPYKRGTLHIWLPDRNQRARVTRIISSPNESVDILISKTKEL